MNVFQKEFRFTVREEGEGDDRPCSRTTNLKIVGGTWYSYYRGNSYRFTMKPSSKPGVIVTS